MMMVNFLQTTTSKHFTMLGVVQFGQKINLAHEVLDIVALLQDLEGGVTQRVLAIPIRVGVGTLSEEHTTRKDVGQRLHTTTAWLLGEAIALCQDFLQEPIQLLW